MTTRRSLLAAAGATALIWAPQASAQAAWPTKPVRMLVPFAAGGTTDLFGRMIANHLTETLGQSVVVENRSGAGGNIGVEALAKAAPDGYTIGMGTVSTHAINPNLFKGKLNFDADKDFAAISLVALVPNLLVVNPQKVPAKTMPELIAFLKAEPGKHAYGSSGVGTSTHLAAELFSQLTGVKINHIPYRASNQVMSDLVAGTISLAFDNVTLAWPQAQAGTVRALGVTTADRQPFDKELPTVGEAVAGFEAASWHALFAPAGTPAPIVDRLSREVQALMAKPETQERVTKLGAIPVGSDPARLEAHAKAERARWGGVVEKAGITPP